MIMARIARVVWAENDSAYGALRRIDQTQIFEDWFGTLQYTATPAPDLQEQQRRLLAQWDTQRGYAQSRWYR